MDELVDKVKIDQTKASEKMDEISGAYLVKAQEATIAHYLDTIANSLQRELGNAPHSPNKVKEESSLDKYYQSEDSLVLKNAAENLGNKIQAIGLHLVEQKKFKKKAEKILYELEKSNEKYIKIDFFRKEHEDYQERIRDYVMIQMGNIQENLTQHRDEQVQTVNLFEEHIEKIKKETLWKITDCEDIIKTRISE